MKFTENIIANLILNYCSSKLLHKQKFLTYMSERELLMLSTKSISNAYSFARRDDVVTSYALS